MDISLEAFHKRRLQLRGWGFVQCGHFAGKGFFRCERLHFLEQKTSEFSKVMVCPLDKERGGRRLLRIRPYGCNRRRSNVFGDTKFYFCPNV